MQIVRLVTCIAALCLCVQADDPAPNTTSTQAPTTPTVPTTVPPSTSTSPAPVTTPSPPSPDNKRGNWTVVENNVTCIILQMAISSKIVYPQLGSKNGTYELAVPANAVATGTCAVDSQSVVLSWEGSSKLEIVFGLNSTSHSYFISNISLSIVADNKTFPNITEKWVNQTVTLESKSLEFNTHVNQSYRCSREQNLPLQLKDFPEAVLVLNQVQLQAFHKEAPAVFGEAQDCELDTPDIVPIAVGCALAGLVLVVLVAYLIGRRRSQARGYLSMFPE